MIGDESGLKIQAALWGSLASIFDLQLGQVLAIKNARVSDYGGKSLNSGDDHASIYIEPDHHRTIELQKWHAAHGGTQLQSLSAAAGSGEGAVREFRLVKEVVDQVFKDEQAMAGQPLYFKLSGHVSRVVYDDQRQMYFVGCPECKRKVGQERENYFRCEACNKTMHENETRITYTLTCRFSDASDAFYVQLIGEQADAIVGMKGADFRNLRETQGAAPEQLREIMNQGQFAYHQLILRAKIDDYQGGNSGGDEVRFRYQVVRVQPMEFKEENEMLLKRLKIYSNK